VNPVFQANNTYTTVDAVYQVLALPQYNAAACTMYAGNLAYWANVGQIQNDCQGVAYQTMLTFMAQAAHMTNITQRTLLYNMLDHVGEELGLYIWFYQALGFAAYGTWINPATIGTNPMIQGGTDYLWYNFQYVTASFTVSFHETGLTSGTAWSVTMSTVSSPSTTAYANFTSQANGTYSWQAAYVAGYTLSPASGTLKVAGANVTVDLVYAPITTTTYALTVNEAGLVSGTSWSVIVNGVGTQWGNMSQFTFKLPAGTYAVYGGFVVAYNNSSAVKSVTISTAAVATTLVYTGTVFSTYSVTFVPVNLPGSQTWNVTLNGWTNSSTGGSIVFWEAAGTYLLVVTTGTSSVVPTFATGTVTVAANMTVTEPMVTAAHPGYALTFTETGLPAGTAWTLTIGGFSNTSTATSNAFTAPNGTYNWTVKTIGGYTTTTWSGSAVVNGTATSVTIKFVQFTYPVTFFEGGLPTGTSWSVTARGQTVTSTSYFLTIDLPNGTASFKVGTVTGFIATPASGTVTVTAGPATQVIIFGTVPTLYSVTFTETGLPTGGSWTVYLNGQSSGSSTGATVTFSVVNGTYTFTVVPPSGYTASTALTGNTITVAGKAVSVAVTFAPTTTSTTTTVNNNNYIGTTAWAIIGVVIVLALIFLILALYFARRKPPMASPPQTWSGTPPTNTGDSTPPPSPPSS